MDRPAPLLPPVGPVETAAFSALSGLATRFGPKLVVAVSGGSDSLALAALVARWRTQDQAPEGTEVLACIVDHGLREGSDRDAAAAWHLCQSLGLPALVRRAVALTEGGGPASRIQERARDARHRILAEDAERIGARLILLGHTADDQAETVAMRLVRRTGLEGLAGMAPAGPSPLWRDFPDAVVARPLVRLRRAALRDWLRVQGLAWLDDPANGNRAFERVRMRARLAALETAGADVETLALVAGQAWQLRACVDQAALAGLSEERTGSGPVLTMHPGTSRLAARQLVLACASLGDAARVPDLDQALALLPQLAAGKAVTLAGAVVRPGRSCWLIGAAPPRKGTTRPVPRREAIGAIARARLLAGQVSPRHDPSVPAEQPFNVGEGQLHEGGAAVIALA